MVGPAGQDEEALSHYCRLMEVIIDVHSQRDDDLCWMDIDQIFLAAGLPVPDRRVGDKLEMVGNCLKFINGMCKDGGAGWVSYADLARVVKRVSMAYQGEGDIYEAAREAQILSARLEELASSEGATLPVKLTELNG